MLPSLLLPVLLLFLSVSLTAAAAAAAAARCTTSTPIKTYQKCMNLPTQGASLAWTYHPHNATLDLAFSGTFISPSGWVAWGLNPDSPAMTGTRALVAFSDPTSGGLLLLPFILDPGVKLQRSPLVSRPLDVPLLSSSAMLRSDSSVRDGAGLHIFATLRLSPNRTRINHVWNHGLYVQGYSPTIHPTAPSDLASRATIDVVSTATEVGPAVPSWFRSTHAVLNAASWGFLLPVGVTVARYLRQCTSVRPTWFYGHAAVQIVGFLFGTAGFSMGIIMGRASPGVTYTLHRGLGVAAFVTGGLQAAALLFRPKTTNRFRKYWKSYHHFVGYGCVVLGVVNVFQGFEVMELGGSYWKLGYCLVLSTLVGVCVALEANAWVVFCRRAEEEKVRREGRVEGHQAVKGSISI
ncbi:cytochrome b561 and DOMON domain-containing protein At2g04850 [Phoenix dactylifera]|uniref:Cytochrome b561 and DOMON domain-containing protein n=1 Tax=Phoenix dactylifera TaxID=42345 RepID=A0A8B7BKX5_PHODC|nr:cytochrome b561 and DOMON domain-containing protein At2g04850 [Phoenix dactylifera]